MLSEGSACTANEQCQDTCRDGICAPRGGYGTACDSDRDCTEDYACSVTDPYGRDVGRCLGTIESPCTSPEHCASDACECADATCSYAWCSYYDVCTRCEYRITAYAVFSGLPNCGRVLAGHDDIVAPCGPDAACNGNGACAATP